MNIKINVSEPHFRGRDFYEFFIHDGKIYDIHFVRGNYEGGSIVAGQNTTIEEAMVKALIAIENYQKG